MPRCRRELPNERWMKFARKQVKSTIKFYTRQIKGGELKPRIPQGGYISSPAGGKMISSNEPFLYQTPQRKSAALDDLDSFSISSA